MAHSGRYPGLVFMLNQTRPRWLSEQLFHWSAALGLLPWLALMWLNGRAVTPWLAVGYVVQSWLLLGLVWWLQRQRWAYGRAWAIVAHLSNLTAVGFGIIAQNQLWLAGGLMGIGAFYFVIPWVVRQNRWLFLGGWVFMLGWWLLLIEILLLETVTIEEPLALVSALLAVVVFLYACAIYFVEPQSGKS